MRFLQILDQLNPDLSLGKTGRVSSTWSMRGQPCESFSDSARSCKLVLRYTRRGFRDGRLRSRSTKGSPRTRTNTIQFCSIPPHHPLPTPFNPSHPINPFQSSSPTGRPSISPSTSFGTEVPFAGVGLPLQPRFRTVRSIQRSKDLGRNAMNTTFS